MIVSNIKKLDTNFVQFVGMENAFLDFATFITYSNLSIKMLNNMNFFSRKCSPYQMIFTKLWKKLVFIGYLCNDGPKFQQTLEKTISSGKGWSRFYEVKSTRYMWQLCAALMTWLELQLIILLTWICSHFSFLIKCY